MNYNNWTPDLGDYIFPEDDNTKKHSRVLKRQKINKILLIASFAVIVSSAFISVLHFLSKS